MGESVTAGSISPDVVGSVQFEGLSWIVDSGTATIYLAVDTDQTDKTIEQVILNGVTYTLAQNGGYQGSLTFWAFDGPAAGLPVVAGQNVSVEFVLKDAPGFYLDGNITFGVSQDPTLAGHVGYGNPAVGSFGGYGTLSPDVTNRGQMILDVDIAQVQVGTVMAVIRIVGDHTGLYSQHPSLWIDGAEFTLVPGSSGVDSQGAFSTFVYSKTGFTKPSNWIAGNTVTLKF